MNSIRDYLLAFFYPPDNNKIISVNIESFGPLLKLTELFLNTNKCTNADFRNENHLNNMEAYLSKCMFEDEQEVQPPHKLITPELFQELQEENEHLRKTLQLCISSVYLKKDFVEN